MNNLETSLISFKGMPWFNNEKRSLELCFREGAFFPNKTTKLFGDASFNILSAGGKLVYESGAGICPLGIWAALMGNEVHSVEHSEFNYDLAMENKGKYGDEIQRNEGSLEVYHGSFLEPLSNKRKADVILGDVSGIADIPGKLMGWYSDKVSPGGDDGTKVIVPLIEQARDYLDNDGKFYFPISFSLSDWKKIMNVAKDCFGSVNEALRKAPNFPVEEDKFEEILSSYELNGGVPDFILDKEYGIRKRGSKLIWTGSIFEASIPLPR